MILIIKFLLALNCAALMVLIVYKTIRLPKSTRQFHIRRWFYFNVYEIHARESLAEERMFQNRLSVILVYLFACLVMLFLFSLYLELK